MAFRILTAPPFPPMALRAPQFFLHGLRGPRCTPIFPRLFGGFPREWEAGRGTWGHERGSEGQEQGGTSACMREREGNKVYIPCFTTQTCSALPARLPSALPCGAGNVCTVGGCFWGHPRLLSPRAVTERGGVAARSLLVQERCEGLGHAAEPRGLLADPLVVPPARRPLDAFGC